MNWKFFKKIYFSRSRTEFEWIGVVSGISAVLCAAESHFAHFDRINGIFASYTRNSQLLRQSFAGHMNSGQIFGGNMKRLARQSNLSFNFRSKF